MPGVSTWWSSWAIVYIAISVPTFSFLILHHWIPDSPRWLLKHGRVEEAKNVLLEAAKVNRKENFLEDDLNKQLYALAESMRDEPPEPSAFSIWQTSFSIKRKLFAAHIGWSIYLMLYFGLLLHVRAMGRNYLEVNTIIAGISEIVGTFIGLYLILNTTRKWLWTSLLNIATSLIMFSANFVPDTVPPFQRMMIYMATSMIAKMSVSTSLSIFITSTTEIVPKEMKKMCNHSGVTCSRTLVMIAPFIGYCVIYGQLSKDKIILLSIAILNCLLLVPSTIMSGMNIAASILVATCISTPRTLPKETTFRPTESQFSDACIRNDLKKFNE